MEDLSGYFKEVRDSLDKLGDQVEQAKKSADYSTRQGKKGLAEAEETINRMQSDLNETKSDLKELSSQVEDDLTETRKIGSRLHPLFDRANELTDYFKEKKIIPIIGGMFIGASIFFFEPSLTGNVVGNIGSGNIFGGGLLILGIALGLLSFRRG